MTHTIIVGAGSAGCALAARLTEDPQHHVTLIEAGDTAPPAAELRTPYTLAAVDPHHPANWAYPVTLLDADPQPDTHTVPRGKIIGGSSTINGGYFIRARPADFAHWASIGGPGWDYPAALPTLDRIDHDTVHVTRPAQDGLLAAAFTAAARAHGFPDEVNKNDPQLSLGVGPVPSNFSATAKVSAADAYLPDRATRPNLTVLSNTRVFRVHIEHGTATGVDTEQGRLTADTVILTAGAVETAHLLLLSGIGPADQLAQHGIPCVAPLPVGTAFSDHPNLSIDWNSHPSVQAELEAQATTGHPFPTALHLTHRHAELEILLAAPSTRQLFPWVQPAPPSTHWGTLVALQTPNSRGTLELRSADPCDPPRISYHYLNDPADRDHIRFGVRTAASILTSPQMQHLVERLTTLDATTLSDDTLLDAWIRTHLGTAIHLSATAPLGSVADAAGRVHHISGLRIADTSLLPRVPARGTAHSALFVAETIAATLRPAAPTTHTRPDHH